MFADADLLGVPVRVIVSPKNLDSGCVELMTRDKRVNEKVPAGEILPAIQKLIRKLYDEINSAL